MSITPTSYYVYFTGIYNHVFESGSGQDAVNHAIASHDAGIEVSVVSLDDVKHGQGVIDVSGEGYSLETIHKCIQELRGNIKKSEVKV